MPPSDVATDPSDLAARVEGHEFWYHTIDVAPGVTTPGWFDLRHAIAQMPWPDVEGKRCLDIGTFDGFFAFEMERRGAAEVVAIDIEDHALWDWPADARPGLVDMDRDPGFSGPPKGDGFRLLAELTGSKAEWRGLSIYDLSPETVGKFDVVVCGSLLLHLQNPVRALEAVRSVCDGWFLSSEQVAPVLTLLGRKLPLFRLDGSGGDCQWWLANRAGHERLLYSAGFSVVERSKPYTLRFNVHPHPPMTRSNFVRHQVIRAMTGDPNPGVLHAAALARPRI